MGSPSRDRAVNEKGCGSWNRSLLFLQPKYVRLGLSIVVYRRFIIAGSIKTIFDAILKAVDIRFQAFARPLRTATRAILGPVDITVQSLRSPIEAPSRKNLTSGVPQSPSRSIEGRARSTSVEASVDINVNIARVHPGADACSSRAPHAARARGTAEIAAARRRVRG